MTAPRNGDRIRLTGMAADPDPIQVGQLGTVVSVTRHGGGRDAWNQIEVAGQRTHADAGLAAG